MLSANDFKSAGCVDCQYSLAANLAGLHPPLPGVEIPVRSNTRYVPGQNFLVSQPILIILGALESTGSLLSKTLKIIEIGSEMTKFWSQTYATVTSLDLECGGVAPGQSCCKVE